MAKSNAYEAPSSVPNSTGTSAQPLRRLECPSKSSLEARRGLTLDPHRSCWGEVTTGPEFRERPQWFATQGLRARVRAAFQFDAIDAPVNQVSAIRAQFTARSEIEPC